MHLFAYGTLMCAEILQSVAGCAPPGAAATLAGYARRGVRNASYPAVTADAAGRVGGIVYRNLPADAWPRLDRFEGPMYRRCRVPVVLADGTRLYAQVYVAREEYRAHLTRNEWDYAEFLNSGLADVRRCRD